MKCVLIVTDGKRGSRVEVRAEFAWSADEAEQRSAIEAAIQAIREVLAINGDTLPVECE